MSLSNTARETALVYPRDLWFSLGTCRDVRNSATLLAERGRMGQWTDRPPRGSLLASPRTPVPWNGIPGEGRPGCLAAPLVTARSPHWGRARAGLKAKVSKFASGLQH